MKKNKKGKNTIAVIIAIAILAVIVIVALSGFITDWMWFDELGYVSVFLTEIKSKLVLGLPIFAVSLMFGIVFLTWLKRSFLRKNEFSIPDKNRKRVNKLQMVIAIVFAVLVSVLCIEDLWFEILKYLNASSFDLSDPLFNKDIGFYVFKLEFLTSLSKLSVEFAVMLMILTVVFFLLLLTFSDVKENYVDASNTDSVVFDVEDETENSDDSVKDIFAKFGGEKAEKAFDEFNRNRKKHSNFGDSPFIKKLKALLSVAAGEVIVIGVLFFVAVAVRFMLLQYNLLYGGTGAAYGAGYSDILVTLNIYRVICVCALISAVMLVIAIKRKKLIIGLIFPAVIVVCILVQEPLVGLVQNFIVAPDEINKEREYIGYNIEYTRTAYDLADITVRDFEPQTDLTKYDVLNNMETFSNIRINDFEPAEQFYNQTQSIRSYYTFNDVDVDRYSVNGEYTQVFLAAREIDQSKVEDSWLIKHIKYTHGYGITLSRVDKVTSSGQPDMLIDSIPPVSDVSEIKITRPEIYYGESTDEYVIVGTDEQEFDYPSGETNVYCEYEGTGGISLTFFKRILFSIREGSLKMFVSGNIDSNSRIMIYRDIMQRVKKIAPFLQYDNNPCLVVDDEGRLYWIVDAYTTSAYYPYSEPYQYGSDINYIRNSVKIVIDAYNGTTDFYIADENDPIVETLAKIYPGLFKNLSDMPSDIQKHIQYPNALVSIQASVYMKYHMTDEEVFYQNEDLWAIANELYGQTESQLIPINFIMKLPGEEKAEFITSIPYTPNGKSNMTGLLIARSDAPHYGELILYRLPKDRIIYGPAQIEAQINQDAEISKEFSLWSNSGVTYSRGNLFVFPVEDSLLYAEPIYMESSSSSLPEVKRVVMYYGDQVAYESTLAECLDTLFGDGAGDPLRTSNPIDEGQRMAAELLSGVDEDPEPETETPVETEQETVIDQNTDRDTLKSLIEETTELLEKLQSYLNSLQ